MAQGGMKLDQQFILFSKFGDAKSDGKTITLSQVDKWFKQAQVLDKSITMTDTGVAFNKFKSRTISFADFLNFLEDLAQQKKIGIDSIKEKLQTCGLPGADKTSKAPKPTQNIDTL